MIWQELENVCECTNKRTSVTGIELFPTPANDFRKEYDFSIVIRLIHHNQSELVRHLQEFLQLLKQSRGQPYAWQLTGQSCIHYWIKRNPPGFEVLDCFRLCKYPSIESAVEDFLDSIKGLLAKMELLVLPMRGLGREMLADYYEWWKSRVDRSFHKPTEINQ